MKAVCCVLVLLCCCSCARREDSDSGKSPRISFFADAKIQRKDAIPQPTPPPVPVPKTVSENLAPSSYTNRHSDSDAFRLYVTPEHTSVLLMQNETVIFQTNRVPEEGLIPNVPDGEYDILLNAAGYDVYRDSISIRDNKAPTYFSLHRLTGELGIKSDANVSVTVFNTNRVPLFTDRTSVYGVLNTQLPEGRYTVELSKTNHYTETREVLIEQGYPVNIEARLRGIPARIWIASGRTADVWEGSRRLGTTGMVISNLDAGKHELTLKSPGFRPQTMTIEIPPNTYQPLVAPALNPAMGALSITVTSTVPDDTWFESLEKLVTLSPKDCRRIKKSILFRDVRCGFYEINVKVPGYRLRDELPPVEIKDEQTNSVLAVMEPLPARVRIDCTPNDATVYSGSQRLGPCNSTFLVPPFAKSLLRIHRPEYTDYELDIPALSPESTTNFTVTLDPEIRLEDLVINFDAGYTPVTDLAAGSFEARARQQEASQKFGLPVEVRTAKTQIPLRLVPPGRFYMGSPFSELGRDRDEAGPITEEQTDPRVEVVFSQPFYVGKTEITQAQWTQVMGTNPAVMKGAGPKAPVENISWEECREFCANLCRIEGVPEGTYRLLTEPEWEYSCRAGTQDPTYIGICEIIGENNAPDLDRIAWYSGNSGVVYKEGWNSAGWPEKQYDHRRAGTQPVGLKQPNAWGLYDMLGNVWEWTADRYLPIYPPGILRDPGSPEHGSARVCRGGAWYTKPVRSRAAERYENSALYRASNLGVRIARRIPNDRLSSKP